jgi:hypothetical protein
MWESNIRDVILYSIMTEYFGREFEHVNEHLKEDLRNLERQGCVYAQLWNDDLEKAAFCRIQFEPDEIVNYVDSLTGYEEFLEATQQGLEPDDAIEQVSDNRVRRTAKDYAEWVIENNHDQSPYCPAAFYLGELEGLLCGSKPDRYEFLQESYTGDRRFLLTEIFEGFAESAFYLQDRDGDRPDFEITCEQDFQDLLYAIMKPIFPDMREEEYTPKYATNSKRIDFVIPEISTVIEAKYVRDSNHATKIPEELMIDIESYHAHTNCQSLYGFVWDGDGEIVDRSNFENELSGTRTIDGNRLQVEIIVIP